MDTPAVFFDRDDTIMKNIPYLGDPSKVEVYAEAGPCLKKLAEWGFSLFVISNQSGVGRGLITPPQVELVNAEMIRQLGNNYFQRVYSCFEEPNQARLYQRKPSPQLLFEAAREFGLDLSRSFMVGDRLTDILAGRNAGCRTILILSGHQLHERPLASRFANAIAENLADVAQLIKMRGD